ncbi:MAG: DNA mismatch repair endonuclease MutL [Planctomycetota bacterium]
MGKIRILDANLINMIAAGEVIERPASVLKELLENSIDASAEKILIHIEDGGRKLIRLSDNGRGMSPEDLALAFEQHTTSKIKTPSDLSKISTMGFRGEALASIASVARVRALSREQDALEACSIEIDCGQKSPPQPCSGSYGTAIEVRDIFYKLPARRKFLRTANTEMSHIIEHFTRIALSHCAIDMTLNHNTRQLYHLPAAQGLRERIALLLSSQVADDLLETQRQEKTLRISALLGHPASARASNRFQYIFLNSRFVRDKFILHAIREAYRGLIEPNKYPVAFVFIEMPCEAYDINVHPTKLEVRFDNANMVYSQVLAALREKLLSTNLDVTGRFSTVKPLDVPSIDTRQDQARKERIAAAMADFFRQNTSSQTNQQKFTFEPSGRYKPKPAKDSAENGYTIPQPARIEQIHVPERHFFQLHDSYIVAQVEDGFIIVDQHALHERIIYEDLCRRIAAGRLESQRLLIPESFEITDAHAAALMENSDLIEKLGIELEPFGPRTIAIQAFPVLLHKTDMTAFMRDLLDLLAEKTPGLDQERLLHEVLDMAACKAAVKAGEKLSGDEIDRLLADKEVIERAGTCPHGRPTTLKFSLADLEKQFKRTR